MKLYVFTVHDAKAEAYLPPFSVPTVAVGVRSFVNCANDPSHLFCTNGEDYTLFHMGTFDSSKAVFDLFSTPKPIGKASEFKRSGVVSQVPPLAVVEK